MADSLKPRWKEHEFVLVTILAIISVAGNIWHPFTLSPEEVSNNYTEPFTISGIHFSYLRNRLLPQAGSTIASYGAYCWLCLAIVPALWAPGRNNYRRYTLCVAQMVILILLLGTIFGICAYYEQEYSFVHGLKDDANRRVVVVGMKAAFSLLSAYLLYSSLRELTLRFLENNPEKRSFRVKIANQVSAFLVVYFTIPFFLFQFDIVRDFGPFLLYFTVFPPILLLCLINLYWLFPLKGERSMLSGAVLWRLLASAFFITLPFSIAMVPETHAVLAVILFFWLGQLLVVTPISWMIYQQRKDSILQVRGLEKELGESNASLQFLRSQINPHFLFNALNTLYGTALQENAVRAAEGIQKLGDMMRFMLHENNQDKIPMHKEIEYLRNYIALQKLRTQSSPSIRILAEIDDSHCHHSIAPMLLVPFVENAFKHGISLQETSWVNIKLYCDEKTILFEVRNSVHAREERDPEKDRSGIGMKNVLHRLRLIYPRQHQFFVNGDEKEFYVQLVIEPGK